MHYASANLTETDLIAALVNSAYRGQAAKAGWTAESDLLDGQRTDATMLRETLTGGRTDILTARDRPDGPLIGCVSLEPTPEPGIWYVGMLTVAPDRQADGLGRQLLTEAERFAQRKGATRIRMTVIQQRDSLIAWYGRRGYRLTGSTEPFPYGDERFGIPRRADLRFVVLEKELSLEEPESA